MSWFKYLAHKKRTKRKLYMKNLKAKVKTKKIKRKENKRQ